MNEHKFEVGEAVRYRSAFADLPATVASRPWKRRTAHGLDEEVTHVRLADGTELTVPLWSLSGGPQDARRLEFA